MDTAFLKEHNTAIMVIIAMIIGLFSYSPMGLPIFAWIWPAILLYALRRLPLKRAIWVSILAAGLPMLLAHISALMGSESESFPLGEFLVCALIVITICLLNCVPFMVDRVAYKRTGKYAQMFLFPLAWAFTTFLCTLTPWGAMMSIAYSQAEFGWFTQSLSVIGMLGMVFVIGWFATSVNLFIEEYSIEEKVDWPSTICAFVIVAIVIFGAVRVSTVDDSDTIDVMCANGHNNLKDGKDSLQDSITQFDTIYEKAIDSGADMLVFSEESFDIRDDDIERFESHVEQRVRSEGLMVMTGTEETKDGVRHNACTLYTENGMQWKYYKTKLIPLSDTGTTPGDGTKYMTDTECGRITSVICMDLEFPGYVRTIDPKAEMLISPSWDWEGIAGWHTRNTSFRAIENGTSFLRVTMDGTIGSYDQYGRLVDHVDNFPKDVNETHMVKMTTKGCETFYGHYGNIVDWTFVIAFIVLAGAEIYLYYSGRKENLGSSTFQVEKSG